jgi:RNA polymerase sigma-B factor
VLRTSTVNETEVQSMSTARLPALGCARHRRRPGRDRIKLQEAERGLLIRYHSSGDLHAREELVKRFLPLARELALRYKYANEPFEDLLQVACLGLIKAVDRYEPERETKFASYAAPTILGELKRHFRDKSWALRVPRGVQERAVAVNRETETLSKYLGRSPTVREVAEALGLSVEEVLEASEAAASYETASLDAPVAREGDESALLVDLVGEDDSAYELVENRDAIAATWRALPEIERKVVHLRFIDDLTQREIGERIGYSQMHVSRLLRRAIKRLETVADTA